MKSLLFVILFLSLSCMQSATSGDNQPENDRDVITKLKGTWVVNDDKSFFTSMKLSDSIAEIYTRGDTMLYLKWNAQNNVLSFFKPYEDILVYRDSIVVNNDSILILNTFLTEKYEHHFSR